VPPSVVDRPVAAPPSGVARQWRWIHSPAVDLAVAFCWVPVVALVRYVEPSRSTLALVMGGVFLLSFAHQPLTLALVYGDGERYRQRRHIYRWSPLLFVAVILALLHFNLVLLAVIGGLWNAEHTLMQRYGLTRIYGRKGGDDHGRSERLLLIALLVSALAWTAADAGTPARLRQLSLGGNNRRGVEVLTSFGGVARVLIVPLMILTIGVFAWWVWQEVRRGADANPAKWAYMGATIALVLTMFVDPVAGLMGYVAAHAIEYFVIVHQSLGRRYIADSAAPASVLRSAVRARPGRVGFFAGYAVVVLSVVTAMRWYAPVIVFGVVYFTLGGLHIFYDGFIWKLRDPNVAASLAVANDQPLGPNRSTRM
jgi:hypothetical protein